jgi:hypothetical protein
VYLWSVQVLDTHGSCIESAYGRNGVGLDTAEQLFQEVVELEYLIGHSRNVRRCWYESV